jgi:hypothetical protein
MLQAWLSFDSIDPQTLDPDVAGPCVEDISETLERGPCRT